MINIAFEWDAIKASVNRKKHGISFEEEKTVFYDEKAAIIHDPEHSLSEERFVLLGFSVESRILVVIHCYRKKDKVIRIISARKATKKNQHNIMVVPDEKEYDFSKAKKNPYIHDLKKQVTIRLDFETIDYFKHLSEDNGVPYQTLINFYLRDCAKKHKKLNVAWAAEK